MPVVWRRELVGLLFLYDFGCWRTPSVRQQRLNLLIQIAAGRCYPHYNMYNLLTSAFTVIFLPLGLVSAAPAQPQAQHFKVSRVATGIVRVRNHGAAIRKAYGKYGIPLPEDFAPSSIQTATSNTSTGQIGSVTNTPTNNDAEFLSPIIVGGQTMMVDFDTGSSDLYVPVFGDFLFET